MAMPGNRRNMHLNLKNLIDISPRKPSTDSEQYNCDKSDSGFESDSDIGDVQLCTIKNVINIVLLVKQMEAVENGELSELEDEEINKTINEVRSSDVGKLRDQLSAYVTSNSSVAFLNPPIPPGASHSQLGLNHPVLTGYLCSMCSVAVFIKDPVETRKKLESGKIKITSTNFPVFLWEDNSHNFNIDNLFEGFLCGFYIVRIMRHIFTGPSTGMGGKARGSKPNNSELNFIDQVINPVPATASTPNGRKDVPKLSELSDLEDNIEKAKKKKAVIKRGKRKAVVVNSDEKQEPQAYHRVMRRKK
ncbi:hypothetical protein HD554DRAFT_2042799 [Boletus coccyginus]|nr:hypothetical protein HD554DRAFT_2042799 [Boletus coccyginus]